jgi:translation initiation factor eIF-2B subunit delta
MENAPAAPTGSSQSPDAPSSQQPNGAPKPSAALPTINEEKKVSGKELKAQKAAEKAARRAQKKSEDGPSQIQPSTPKPSKKGQQQQQNSKPGTSKPTQGATLPLPNQQSNVPHRGRRLSTSAPAVQPVVSAKPKAKTSAKQVSLFGHLYGQPRRYDIEGTSKEVHPAVLALGLQMSNYEVCGSTARCVAMLLAFKSVGLILY